MTANGTFNITDWKEETYRDLPGEAKLTQAHVTQSFEGDVKGEGQVEYLMNYLNKSNARFTGQKFIEATLDNRKGAFTLHLTGIYNGESVQATWQIVSGSGTEGFQGISGEGTFDATGQTAKYSLEYFFNE